MSSQAAARRSVCLDQGLYDLRVDLVANPRRFNAITSLKLAPFGMITDGLKSSLLRTSR
jgi:hypothetical protein